MKVLYCYRYGILGGVCTQLLNRIRGLDDGGGPFEAHLLFSRDYGIGRTLEGYPHLLFEPDPQRARAYARSQQFDAVVVIDTPEYLRPLGSLPGVPLIIEVHTTVERGLAYLEEERWWPAGFVVPSDYSRRLLCERFGYDRTPIETVPNCLDPDLFPRVEVASSPQRPVFGWVGKLDDHKNWRGFLEVARAITDLGLDSEFWLVGGETAPAEAEAELLCELDRFDLMSRARWFPRIEYRAMHRFYAAVRQSGGAMVVTTIDESFGMSILEALMCGTPVVASRVGGLSEIAPGRSYVRFYEWGDYRHAAELAAELADPEIAAPVRAELAEDRSRLEESYSPRHVGAQYLQALKRLGDGWTGSAIGHGRAAARVGEGELDDALAQLRQHIPGGAQLPDDPEALIRTMTRLLDRRSYRLARLLAARPGDLAFWLALPKNLVRVARKR